MRYVIAAVGRMKAGADRDLLDRYLDRARKTGKGLGVSAVDMLEHAESRAARAEDRKADEAAALLQALPARARLVVLDETGKTMTSPALAERLRGWMDEGTPEIVFAIGGADGHGDALRDRADVVLALGAMTWPHQIVRILIAEQIYRAFTIQAGHPYHRV
ncbi:23S rRNA (pseudouridine(1915)-N(3))-methyltransferase RlmH [Microvirga tunisiensis]|uniref:23S rRNA (Pseudouridine(1915)-N(3))-methyltransferase RlmH n=2 Tax=Pannonibacter tanglangensis TaxID=2750084 RepID=A0ABW9ZJ58_9HYPH|nr:MULTISPECIES: 23S rRNA (pseudouridine(1915)-N(3))-methyltransferase RlmH [unclassified Pannonibacter]NBN64915.1 23S rRNA (pseudouridine(1915)-N(3))-methyltransferase RlmH [Pannonibacter sp. XCT-34]NBN79418.1 23S rRNA (pseudouridine(1915)-N(3))-methyltransferase RlmH [Pannonibacter sp. XCT-53]